MNTHEIVKTAALLVKARRDMVPLKGLPDGLKPATIDEGHAIQDATSKSLGKLIGGFKAMAPPGQQPNRGIIYADTIHASPCDLPAARVPQCGVEGEVAFVFRQSLPNRAIPYSRNEVAAVVDAMAAIEVVLNSSCVSAKNPTVSSRSCIVAMTALTANCHSKRNQR